MKQVSRTLKKCRLLSYCLLLLTLLHSKTYADSLTGLTLINAATDTDLKPLTNGETIDLSVTGNRLTIRANTNADPISKIVFSLDGVANFRTEKEAPYSLAGDNKGDYHDWIPAVGKHTLVVTPYNSSGTAGTPITVSFTVVAKGASEPEAESPPGGTTTPANVVVQGEIKKWHKITLLIDGPTTSETASTNPFLNYRLNVTFTKGAKTYRVPGYFAADGNAGETSAGTGNRWKVHFAPDETGTWTYSISMRTGANIAVSDDLNAGSAVASVDGKSGTLTVAATDKTGSDLRAKGRLTYVGEHYLKFAETGEYFVKGGVDSPENFLSYDDFDNTPDNGGMRKSWSPHVQDWKAGDPSWKGGKGKGIIGAVNYLASQGLNSFSFLTLNIKGDDRNVFPYLTSTDFTRFDCSKLDQWEEVFEHGDKLGMYLHFKTQENENSTLLDGGSVGTQRKLYYRELIARFSHHLALNWNMGEENTQTTQQRKDMAAYLSAHDPYGHNIVIHTNVLEQLAIYTPLLGGGSEYTGVSIQTDWDNVYTETKSWVQKSASAGKKWIVANDEQNAMGVAADADYKGNRGSLADNQNSIRKESLWGNLMASGAGVEYYFGGSTGETDLAAEDFRSRAKMWRYNKYALDFFKNHVPLPDLKVLSNVSRGWVLGKEGQIYVVYLKDGGSANITISGSYTVQWYDPRNGGTLQNGSVRSLSGSGSQSIGNPPGSTSEDWVALIKPASTQPVPSTNTVYRINAGGDAYTTPDGKVFSADSYSSGGGTYARSGQTEITNTTNDVLYEDERYGNFSYNLPVSNGQYTVTLHFAEIYMTNTGQRKFHVDLEGQRKLTDYDIVAKAGGPMKAVQETFTVTVSDGMLTIAFSKGSADNAKVSAIEIVAGSVANARLSAESEGDLEVLLLGNPIRHDAVQVEVRGAAGQPLRLQLLNARGQVVLDRQIPAAEIREAHSLSVAGQAPGLLLLRVSTPRQSRTLKVMKAD